jgi:hypothetical protein
MMKFDVVNETIAVATNSIKEVKIVRSVTEKFDRNEWNVYTPEGRLLDNVLVAGPFSSFENAKRDAEMNVGMTMNWSDF